VPLLLQRQQEELEVLQPREWVAPSPQLPPHQVDLREAETWESGEQGGRTRGGTSTLLRSSP
jgi:hypothetical protein